MAVIHTPGPGPVKARLLPVPLLPDEPLEVEAAVWAVVVVTAGAVVVGVPPARVVVVAAAVVVVVVEWADVVVVVEDVVVVVVLVVANFKTTGATVSFFVVSMTSTQTAPASLCAFVGGQGNFAASTAAVPVEVSFPVVGGPTVPVRMVNVLAILPVVPGVSRAVSGSEHETGAAMSLSNVMRGCVVSCVSVSLPVLMRPVVLHSMIVPVLFVKPEPVTLTTEPVSSLVVGVTVTDGAAEATPAQPIIPIPDTARNARPAPMRDTR